MAFANYYKNLPPAADPLPDLNAEEFMRTLLTTVVPRKIVDSSGEIVLWTITYKDPLFQSLEGLRNSCIWSMHECPYYHAHTLPHSDKTCKRHQLVVEMFQYLESHTDFPSGGTLCLRSVAHEDHYIYWWKSTDGRPMVYNPINERPLLQDYFLAKYGETPR